MVEIKNNIIRRCNVEAEVDLGVGAKKLAEQLSKAGAGVKGYSCNKEEIENAMKYLVRLRVDQINGVPGNYKLVVYPEIFGELVAKMQPVKTDDGIVLNYVAPFSEVLEDGLGKESLEKVVAMCDRMRFRITSGLVEPAVVVSNVIGIKWNEDKDCHESSKKVNESDLMMKVWIGYPWYESWGDLRYEVEEPGAVSDYIKLIVSKQSVNYSES